MISIDKLRIVANITEDHFVSKSIFLRINTKTFMMINQLFHVKNVYKMKKIIMFKMVYGVFGVSTFYLTVSGINIPNLKFIGQFYNTKIYQSKVLTCIKAIIAVKYVCKYQKLKSKSSLGLK